MQGKIESKHWLPQNVQYCDHTKTSRLILTYLIPCHLVTSHTVPSQALLKPYPRLNRLFGPLAVCIRKGDLAGFDKAMRAGEDEFVRKRIYLPLERSRDLAIRSLFRKVFLAGGFEPSANGGTPMRRTRVPVAEFIAAMRMSLRTPEDEDEERQAEQDRKAGKPQTDEDKLKGRLRKKKMVGRDEVECFLGNLIYKVSVSTTLRLLGFFAGPNFNVSSDECRGTGSPQGLYLPSSCDGGSQQRSRGISRNELLNNGSSLVNSKPASTRHLDVASIGSTLPRVVAALIASRPEFSGMNMKT